MLSIVIAFITVLALLLILLKTQLINLALDKPNARSLHQNIIPRTGGLALMLGVLTAWFFLGIHAYWLLLTFVLVAVSLVDDMRGLSVRWRLLAQVLVSGIFVFLFLQGLALFWQVIICLGLVWVINLYNFMDGSDGLAGGMGVFGFSTFALAAYQAGFLQLSLMCACIAVASLAFLIFNFQPAKIFMGDAGSISLGFLAGAIGLYGWQHHVWPIWFLFVVFSPFIVDASITLIKRLLNGEKIWQAHRSHYYQRLIQMGWSHRKTALYEYFTMFSAATSALYMLKNNSHQVFVGLGLCVIIYSLIALFVDYRWKHFKKNNLNK